MRCHILVAAVLAAVGCRAADVAQPLTPAELCARKDSVLAHLTGRTIDDEFEALARLLPGGFGGLTADSMFLKQVELADTVRATAAVLTTCPGELVSYLANVQHTEIRRGDFDWVELRRWFAIAASWPHLGLTTADIDERINRLSFGLISESALSEFRTYAVAHGVPAAALSLSVHPGPIPLEAMAPPSNRALLLTNAGVFGGGRCAAAFN